MHSTLLILKHRLKDNQQRPQITIVKQYGEPTLIDCYAGQRNQVFMNILSNAINAFDELYELPCMGERQAPTITVEAFLEDQQQIITIADNGPGILAAIRQRIFEDFLTTKAVGKGTRIGMALSQQIIVERHHGQLICHSECGHGTAFRIQLPQQQGAMLPVD
ncbi:hypothetical protein IQ266_09175 [filamentous cyanobacterium LEGE 11480]|uniref:histidine kinase n=1 Tax=Romeriopsis navalis LEGE 11480 TaxID=2777977 RepID=A0A928Z3C6_9CYAN|nr:ATP-binding protein [Romeriopsis navalis]MBE9029897.1 hypothetical protein [Romeriopsis navalis LEGE 11480]